MSPVDRLAAIVRQHQAGLLLDTNVLMLHLADSVSPEFAQRWRRTAQFGERYVVPLRAAVGAASRLVTTPHVLTEVTNFTAGNRPQDKDLELLQGRVADFARRTDERFVPSKQLALDPAFSRLGLADVAQALSSRRRRPLVLTVDVPLTAELERRDLPVVNLTNYAFPIEEFSR